MKEEKKEPIGMTQKQMIQDLWIDMKEVKEKVITNSVSLSWNWKITLIILVALLGSIGGIITLFANIH